MRIRVGDGALYFDVEGAQLVPDGSHLREKPALLVPESVLRVLREFLVSSISR